MHSIILYTKNVIGLDGSPKMSTSNINSNPIFIDDTKDIIKQKIMSIKYVGAGTLDELFKNGANLDIDVLYKLIILFEKNTKIIKIIEKAYTTGLITDSEEHLELKKYLPEKGLIIVKNKTRFFTSIFIYFSCRKNQFLLFFIVLHHQYKNIFLLIHHYNDIYYIHHVFYHFHNIIYLHHFFYHQHKKFY